MTYVAPTAWAPLLVVVMGVTAAGSARALDVDDVFGRLPNHPKWKAADAKADEAGHKLRAAQSPFDLKLVGEAGAAPLGGYGERQAKLGFEQRFPGWGQTRLFANYAYGDDFPVYEGKRVTGQLGRAEVGASVQLWKDLFIDDERAAVQRQHYFVGMAEAQAADTQLGLQRLAAAAFFKWQEQVARVDVAKTLLDVAEGRQALLQKQVDAGLKRRLVLADNEQQVLSRRAKLKAAEQKAQAAALKLSLYLRDADGTPQLPASSEAGLCVDVEEPPAWAEMSARQRLRTTWPELKSLALLVDAHRVDEEAADNLGRPKVELQALASQQAGPANTYGSSTTKDDFRVAVGLKVAWSVQRRKARGGARAAQARIRQAQHLSQQVEDAVVVDVESAYTQWAAQHAMYTLNVQAAANARKLADAERRAFMLGQKGLLSVNLREKASAEAQVAAVASCAAAQAARAEVLLLLQQWAPSSTAKGPPAVQPGGPKSEASQEET